MGSEDSNRCRDIAVARYLRASLLFLLLLAGAPAMAQVCINEFQASGSVLQDEDGDTPDWIELFNSASAAFSLSGWYLTDDQLFLTKWQFPNVSIPAGGYLIVFASGKDRRDPAGPLHTNFALRAEGEYLALVHPDGATVEQEFAPAYPPQKDNYSYGLLQTSATLVTPGNPVKALAPADASLGTSWTTIAFNENSSWTLGALPVGYTDRTLATADPLYVDVDAQGLPLGSLATWPNPGLMGNFVSGGSDPVVQTVNGVKGVSFNGANWLKTGTLTQADFTGNSNWSVEVWVCDSAIGDEECMVNWGHRGGPAGTGAQVNIGTNEYYGAVTHWDWPDMGYEGGLPAEGVWNHVVVTYEGGTDGIEKVYLNGDLNATEFKTINIHGPGDGEASPIILGAGTWQTGLGATADDKWFTGALGKIRIHGGVLTADQVRNNYLADAERFKTDGAAGISLDVKSLMRGRNATAYLRIPFSAPGAGTYQSLELDVRYNDGFVAYINGVEVARRNAPEPVGWNSVSSGTVQMSASETVNVSGALGSLTPTGNVLAIQGLNCAADDVDFLIDAGVRAASLGFGDPKYFYVPTPGAVNSGSFTDFVEATAFSVSRGFYDAPFTVEISTPTPGATIRYTTDASWPGETHGTLYTAPVSITKTATLRAIAYLSGFKSSDVVTHTYIFRDNIMTQTRPAGYPTQTYDPGYQLDYDVDQDVIGPASPYGSVYRDRFKSDLLALPTLSIVMDVNDLFGLAGGIYANSNRDGEAWERGGSFEWMDPDTSPTTVQVNCAVRLQGGYGRYAFESPKHNLRFKFRTAYGPGKLRCKLFPDSPVEEFDQLTLRSQTHDSWSTQQSYFSANATYGKDSWHRQTQRDMGHPSVRGRFCHVYLNGLYWGMYELDERPNAAFMASYEGGEEEDYDAIGSFGVVRDGGREAWDEMFRIANGAGPHGSLSNDAAYQDMSNCLDVVNLADYIILNIYSAISDWPGWNYYAARRRVPPGLFRILCWDSEASMTSDRLNYNKLSEGGFNDGIGHLFIQCKQNAEFRMMTADRIYRHLLMPGGALTPARNADRWRDVMAQLEPGMVGESARWGDCWLHPPRTPNAEWAAKKNWVLNIFIPQRPAIVVGFFRNYGVYPGANPPTFNQQGGKVDQGFEVTLTNPNASGTIYYTTDGSDPRAPSETGQPVSNELVPLNADKRVLIPAGDIGTAWRGGSEPFDDSAWTAGLPKKEGAEGGVGYERSSGYETFITYDVSAMDGANASCYIRIPFSVTAQDLQNVTALTLSIRYDDGFVAYVDGVEVARDVAPATPVWNSAATGANENGASLYDFDISSFLPALAPGDHVLAIHGMNSDPSLSSDFLIGVRLTASASPSGNPPGVAQSALVYTPGNPIAMDQTTQIKARVLKGLEWSALNEAVFQVAPTLVDYWSFNDTVNLLTPSYATGVATLEVAPGPDSEVTDSTGQDFSGANAQLGEPAGSHLRINNPLGSTVTLSMPTTGFQALVFKYETRRSGQGAGVQELSYTTDGATFQPLGTVTVLDDVPVLQTFDLTPIPAVNDNPDFAIRITFSQGSGGTAGNNRFDNVTLEGVPIPAGNQPPSVKPLAGFLRAVEGEAAVTVNLKTLFSDPNADPLIYSASISADREAYVLANVAADTLELRGLQRGEATVTVSVTDGKSSPVATPIRLLIYPAPYHLSDGAYRFDQWAPGTPELIYPSHMLFLQSNVSDPGVSAPLDYAYYIPADDYAPTDVVGYPYQNASRTRINGLGVDGISFVNTGRMRDLGGALLALDTTGQSQVSLRWVGGTLLRNSRVCAIRLQYRVGTSGTFLDLLDAGAPVEYMVGNDAHVQALGPIMLPPALLNQPHVQLLWRYYFLSGNTGSRAQLTLDNIEVGAGGTPPSEPADADPATWSLY